MTFAWPWMLLGLLALPALVVGYRRLLARRERRRAALADLALVAPSVRRVRGRHLTPALYLVALALLGVALARPQMTVAEPRREGTVVLAFDTSASMAATDLEPSRIEAAKAAAREVVARQPSSVRLAVVSFGTGGLITQQPTTDRASVLAAVDRIGVQGGTALGRGIQMSLSAVLGRSVQIEEDGGGGVEPQGQDLGYTSSAAIVLLSDGENTSAPDPLEVARVASTVGVRIYTIGLGTPRGAVLEIDGFKIATALDADTLQEISQTTDGRYVAAEEAGALAGVYDAIDLQWTVRSVQTEITAVLAGLAALVLLVGAATSFVRFGRVI